MKNVEVSIQITIKPTEGDVSGGGVATKVDKGHFRLVLQEGTLFDIDALEDAVLNATYPALRDALAHALEMATRERALAEGAAKGGATRSCAIPATTSLDAEVGRFRFGLFDGVDPTGNGVFEGGRLWPARQARQWYPTAGFKALSVMAGVTQRSYRNTVTHCNRSRRQEVDGAPLTTLRDGAEREGRQVIAFLERHSDEVLKAHRFTAGAIPEAQCPLVREVERFEPAILTPEAANEALMSLRQAMRKRGMAPALIEEVTRQSRLADSEADRETVNSCLDEVGVKAQKDDRVRHGAQAEGGRQTAESTHRLDGPRPEANTRPTVQTTVAQIERPGQCFTLTGRCVGQVLRFVLALSAGQWRAGSTSALFHRWSAQLARGHRRLL